MGKTLKRQRKRMARVAASVDSALHRVAFDPADPLWATLEKELLGHMLIIIDEKLDAACPFEISFLLDLSSVRVGCHDRIERIWRRTAEAFAMLVAYAESLWQASCKERLGFWIWLQHSDLMSSLRDPHDMPELEAHRAMLCDLFTVKFVWRSRPFDRRVVDVIYDVMTAERAVFEAKARRTMNARPLRTSVSIMHCALSVEDVRCLAKLLTVPVVNDTESILCQVDSLVELSLSHTSIKTEALIALADIIATSPRRMDSLDLESSMPTDEPPEYLAAFRRLMMALFCPAELTHHGHGMGLSLSHNQLQAVHIEALQTALTEATRPLCSLSLDSLDGTNEATCRRVGELFFSTDARMPNDECQLRLGKATNLRLIGEAIEKRMNAVVGEAIPRVLQALATKVPVICGLSNSRERIVISVRAHPDEAWFLVIDSTSGGSADDEPEWVEHWTLRWLKIGDEFIVRSRFTALHAEGWNWDALPIMNAIGPHLLALSMPNYDDESTLAEMLEPCTKLKSLSLQNLYMNFRYTKSRQRQLALEPGDSPPSQPVHSFLRNKHIKSLQVLLLEDCKLQPAELVSLRDLLASAAVSPLRILGLKGNDIKHEGLAAVREILCQQPQIEYVELDGENWPSHEYWDEVSTHCSEYASVRAQIERDVQVSKLSKHVKSAFLSVLPAIRPLEPSMIECIFAYAGSRAPHVAWVPGSSIEAVIF